MLPKPGPTPPRPKPPQRQRGIALLTVLVIAVLAVTLATAILARQSRAIRQSENFQSLERAWQYALTMEQYAALQLQLDAQANRFDSLADRWAYPLPTQILKEESGATVRLSGKLEDQHSRFNLNNLVQQTGQLRGQVDGLAQNQLRNFASDAGLPAGFINALSDWVDGNVLPTGTEGAERDYYLAGSIPYLAADMPFADISEVRLVRLDIPDPQLRNQALQKFLSMVTALPFKKTTINPNTASRAVLKALRLNDNQINQILEQRDTQPYRTKEAFVRAMGFHPERDKALADSFDVQSQYFRLLGEVEINRARVPVNSLLLREPNGKVRVIMRQFDHPSGTEPPPAKPDTNNADLTPTNAG